MSLPPPPWRLPLLVWLIAIPSVAGALVITTVESEQARERRAMGAQPSGSFAQAICDDRVSDAYRFIRAGADPNAPTRFRHGGLTDDRDAMVSPLMLAVACHQENAILMLLGFGARLDAPPNQNALCLARQMKLEQVAALLERNGATEPGGGCPAPGPGSPLLAYSR